MKNSGLFLNMAKRCFCLFFSGFNVFVVWFFVRLVKCKSVENASFFFFPRFVFFGEASS